MGILIESSYNKGRNGYTKKGGIGMVNEFLRKGFLMGLGFAAMSKEKMERYMEDLVVKGQIAPKEAQELMDAYVKKGEETQTEWKNRMQMDMGAWAKEFGFVSKEELDALQARVEQVEKKLSEQSATKGE